MCEMTLDSFRGFDSEKNTLSYCQHARSQIEEKENKMPS
jgi:hypothetical protein